MANKTIKQLSTEHTTALADDWFLMQKDADSVTGKIKASNVFDGGWKPLSVAPTTITALGNNSYTMLFPSVDYTGIISNGMRIRATRTVAAPNTAFSLDGTNDYYVKTTPNKLTFTDDFVCSAWVYLTAYPSAAASIVSRYNGTSGWDFQINSSGQLQLAGFNASGANYRGVVSYQSVPLNRWVHVTAQLDMSAYTATTTTCYIMVDGVDVPSSLVQGGTNPTALVQAGNLEVGSRNGGTLPFPGYLDQVAVYSAKVTQATILASINRALSGSETSLASAYSNGSVNDLNTTTPNNLTATNGATTVASSPFGNRGVSTTLEYGIVMANTFSTNTTVTVQVPEGCQLPTTGGITSVDYSTQNVPYGFPRAKGRWQLSSLLRTQNAQTSNATYGAFLSSGWLLKVPIGEWNFGWDIAVYNTTLTDTRWTVGTTATVGLAAGAEDTRLSVASLTPTNAAVTYSTATRRIPLSLSTATNYIAYTVGATTGGGNDGDNQRCEIIAENNYI